MSLKENKLKRYNLVLPEELFDEVQKIADIHHTTVVEVLRKFIKIGLFVNQVQENSQAALLIREGGTERQLVLI